MNELDFQGKLYTQEFKEWIIKFTKKENVYPKIVELDPTSFCMFDCPDCINSNLIRKEHNCLQFTYEELEKLIYELHELGVLGIIFIGGGEPLMHKDFSKILYLCKKLNIKIGITTNGLLIDKHMEAIAKFADWTRVSMDAGNPKTFNVVRPNRIKNSFNIICKNISTLSKIKNGKLGYSFLLIENKKLNYSNVSDLFQAAELAKNLGCDYFEYKPMVDENHFLVKYSDEFMNELDNITKKISLLEDEKFKIIYPQSMNQYKEKNLVQYKKHKMCPVTYLRTLITPYGIYPCPYKRGYEKYNIGNIKENSFKNIWNYYKFENHCKEINACKDCNFFCIRDKLNQELLKLVKNPYLIDNIDFGETKDVFV